MSDAPATLSEQLRREALTRAGIMGSMQDKILADAAFEDFWGMLATARTDAASARDDLLDCQRKLALVEKERDIYREWLDDIAAKINTRPL